MLRHGENLFRKKHVTAVQCSHSVSRSSACSLRLPNFACRYRGELQFHSIKLTTANSMVSLLNVPLRVTVQ